MPRSSPDALQETSLLQLANEPRFLGRTTHNLAITVTEK